MICPTCGGEFRPGVRACPDCGVGLVAAPPAAPGPPHPEGAEVLTTGDLSLLMVARSLLESASIPTSVQGEEGLRMVAVWPSGALGTPRAIAARILVPQDRREEARALLDAAGWTAGAPDGGPADEDPPPLDLGTDGPPAERLSSAFTFAYRTAYPAAVTTFLGLATLATWLAASDGAAAAADARWPILLAAVAASSFFWWFGARLRHVTLRGDALEFSGGGESGVIPLRLVEEVRESRLLSPKVITLLPRQLPGLPDRIVFIAPWAAQFSFAQHPVVRKLRARIATASGAGDHKRANEP